MASESSPFRLFPLLWPLLIQQLIGILIGNLQVVLLSHLSGEAVGAVGVANQLLGMVNVLFAVIGTGTAILLSRLVGAGKADEADQVARGSLAVSAAVGLGLSAAFLAGGSAVPGLLSLPPSMASDAEAYIRLVGAASVVQALTISLAAVARSWGDTRLPMLAGFATGAASLAGTALVLFGPPALRATGIAGVAWSAVLGQLVGLGVTLVPLIRSRRSLFRAPLRRWLRRSTVAEILQMGGPAAVESISYTFAQVAVTAFSTAFGAAAINGRIILLNLTAVISTCSYSVGVATQILAGYWKGAGEPERLYGTALRSLRLAAAANAGLSFLFLAFGQALVSLFTDDPEVKALAGTILLVDLAVELGRAFNHILGSSLRGTGDVQYPAVVSILSMWALAVAAGYWLGQVVQLGLAGLWLASALDEWTRGLLLLRRWRGRRWLAA